MTYQSQVDNYNKYKLAIQRELLILELAKLSSGTIADVLRMANANIDSDAGGRLIEELRLGRLGFCEQELKLKPGDWVTQNAEGKLIKASEEDTQRWKVAEFCDDRNGEYYIGVDTEDMRPPSIYNHEVRNVLTYNNDNLANNGNLI